MRLLTVIASVGLLAAASGCGGSGEMNTQDPSQMQGQYGYGYPSGQYGNQQQPGPNQPPPAQTQPAPAQPPPQQQSSGQATPISPAMAVGVTPVMQGMAMQEAPGMQPDGSAIAGQFQQGQTLEQQFNLQAGKCYTVVAVGIGITELDVFIQVQPVPQFPAQTMAQDNQQGAQAVLGGRSNCFKNPLPIGGPAKLVLKATGGSGMAAAQLYSK